MKKRFSDLYNFIFVRILPPYWTYISLSLLAIFIVTYYFFGKTIDTIITGFALTITGIVFLSGSFFTTYSLYESIRDFNDDPHTPLKDKLGAIVMLLIGIAFFYYLSYWYITEVLIN